MPWTLTHDGVTKTFAEWGVSNAVVTLNSFAPSTLTFPVAGNFDAALICAYGDSVTLRDADNVVRFVGKRRSTRQLIAGVEESRSYVFEDVLGDLNRRTLLQDWQMWNGSALIATPQGVATLFVDASGDGLSIAAQITALITSAVAAGVSVQLGTLPTLTEVPRVVDINGKTYLEALKLVSRFVPDLSTWVDYTTSPPTLNFTRRVSATEHDLAVIEHADEFEAEPLEDAQPSGVIIRYEKALVVDGVTMNATYVDAAPEGASATAENALNAHCVLRATRIGSAPRAPRLAQSQAIETVAIDAGSFDFWERLWPDLASRNESAALGDDSVSDAGYRMILSGQQPSWTGAALVVTVRAVFNGVINGEVFVNHQLTATVNASTLTSGTYTRYSGGESDGSGDPDPGEAVPSGIAALLWSALGPLQWQGRHKRAENELTDWSIKTGHLLNFGGTAEERHETARAQVQSVVYDLDYATRELVFGQSPTLLFNDLIELLRAQSTLSIGTRAAERAGVAAASEQSVTGGGMGPGHSITHIPREPSHPFQVRKVGTTGNTFRVEGGSYAGAAIAAVTTDIGATRPLYIYIEAEWTVTGYAGKFADTVERTGTPTIASSTSTTDTTVTLPDGATTAKHLIAVIGASDVITQIVSTNLLPVWQDNGSFSIEAAMIDT